LLDTSSNVDEVAECWLPLFTPHELSAEALQEKFGRYGLWLCPKETARPLTLNQSVGERAE